MMAGINFLLVAWKVNENFSKKVRTFDASSIPPCKS